MARLIGMGYAMVDSLIHLPIADSLSALGLRAGQQRVVDLDALNDALTLLASHPRRTMAGGRAALITSAVARLGLSTGFLGKVGRDEQAAAIRESLAAAGCRALTHESPARTGVQLVLATPDGLRSSITFVGAAGTLNPNDLTAQDLNGYDLLLLEGQTIQNRHLLSHAVQLAHQNHMRVALDLSSYALIDDHREYLHHIVPTGIDVLLTNQQAAHAYTGKEPQAALRELATVCHVVLLQLDNYGVLASSEGEEAELELPYERPVEPSGNDEMLAAGFLYVWLQRGSLESALELGARMAQLVRRSVGAGMSDEDWREATELARRLVP